ncbi:SDR family NAD(P)-dependent oxidoreductase [Micromonospora andamanensis]|uniref:SDR family oxidoreductase n=1 Tax=Micromonospora andamanensis TaxID=1287068 RepID=UPI00194EEA05|nr:SDR family oxidoreductase [Micromonospora andamanensis]GIJ42395.1 short-chain dehydrogenase [Micromonospora andamanensis]
MIRRAGRITPLGRTVVVTGASSGLGRHAALHLERIGFQVFAGVRATADGERLLAGSSAGRLHPLRVDVTEPDQIRQAVDEVAGRLGDTGLWGLVNNAGVAQPGPLECLSGEQLRRQLETNVIGQVETIQGYLPLLRAARGRIVNVTSGLGRVALPYLGAYAAAQFAKEAISDSLRRELRPFGVTVSVVQPGAIRTPIWAKIDRSGAELIDGVPEPTASLYRDPFRAFLRRNARQVQRSRTTSQQYARTVARALTAARPRTRYPVGPDVRLASLAARLLPDSLIDRNLAALVRPRDG